MNELLAKLNGEIRTFTLIQFIGMTMGLIASMGFYLYGKETGSETARVVAILMAGLAFLLGGLCDFFIHRNAGYYPKTKELCGSIAEAEKVSSVVIYENDKRRHSMRFLVPMVYFLVAGMVSYVLWDGVIKTFLVDYFLESGFYLLSLIVFSSGGLWGERGWSFLNPKKEP